MNQPDLLDWTPPVILGDRDGESFERKRDGKRLNLQMQAVYNLMADGRWRTLKQISEVTRCPEASISARLRDLRKSKFGGYLIEKKNLGGGIWTYRMGDV